jgi:hypothetical protein
MSGIRLWEKFLIDDTILPPAYGEDNIDLQVTAINHVINNASWITHIDAIPAPAIKTPGAIKRPPTVTSTVTQQQPANQYSTGRGGATKIIEGRKYENGKMEGALRPIDNMSKYIGSIQSDGGRIRLYTKASIALDQLLAAAEKDGIKNIKINTGYRTYADQVRVWGENCSNEIGTGKCIPKKGEGPAAIPGTSNHGFGLAVDFATGLKKITTQDPLYKWLAVNGAKYGFRRISSEDWHWEYYSLI